MAEDLLAARAIPDGAKAPRALVIAPTRELALQVSKELAWLFGKAGLRIVTCVGGMDPVRERRARGEACGDVVLIGATEHKAVSESLAHWNRLLGTGLELRVLPVDADGRHRLDVLRALAPRLAFVCTMAANNETGGSVIERAEAEYMIRVGGYLKTLDDFRNIPLKVSETGVPVTIGDVARVQIVPDFRRGIAELNGQGEVAGGVIVVRAGADTRSVIDAVKDKLEELKKSLPPGVEV
ncbi:hypothetical protein LTR94_029990, partial [Friedmanniomyces endolithicus]